MLYPITYVCIAVLGILNAIYLSAKYITGNTTCSFQFSECSQVLTSTYAKVLGFPLSIWGIVYFGCIILLFLATLHGQKVAKKLLIVCTAIGSLGSLYLLYIQHVVLHTYCIHCIVNSGLIILLSILFSAKPIPNQPTHFKITNLTLCLGLGLWITSSLLIFQLVINTFKHGPRYIEWNGKKMNLSDIDAPIQGQLYELEKDIYDLRLNEIKTHLIRSEALRLNLTPDTLRDHVLSHTPTPSNKDLQAYIANHPTEIPLDLPKILQLEFAAQAIKTNNQNKQWDAYVDTILAKSGAYNLLTIPVLSVPKNPYYDITYGNGLNKAVLFFQFTCPHCRELERQLIAYCKNNPKALTISYRFYGHSNDLILEKMALYFNQKGQFWAYKSALATIPIEKLKQKNTQDIVQILHTKGFDTTHLITGIANNNIEKALHWDQETSIRMHIQATPALILNGKITYGSTLPDDIAE